MTKVDGAWQQSPKSAFTQGMNGPKNHNWFREVSRAPVRRVKSVCGNDYKTGQLQLAAPVLRRSIS